MDCRCGRRDRDLCVNVGADRSEPEAACVISRPFFWKKSNEKSGQRTRPGIR